jgi:hypothetical protein
MSKWRPRGRAVREGGWWSWTETASQEKAMTQKLLEDNGIYWQWWLPSPFVSWKHPLPPLPISLSVKIQSLMWAECFKFICWGPHSVMAFGGRTFGGGVIMFRWGHESKALWWNWCLSKRKIRQENFLFLHSGKTSNQEEGHIQEPKKHHSLGLCSFQKYEKETSVA